jgi:hypothetical protein
MIERIEELPDNVLGFLAKGTVTAEDYESIIMPAVEAQLEREPKIRFLYVLGDEFEGFEAAAMWDDAKLGLKHLTDWEKIAVVTDVEWLRAALLVLCFTMAERIHVFSNAELAAAKDWIAA